MDMFEEGGEVPSVEPMKIQHSQVERPIIPSSPENDSSSKPSTSETAGEETASSVAGKGPRLTPKPGEHNCDKKNPRLCFSFYKHLHYMLIYYSYNESTVKKNKHCS